jgi:hypothetical protein
LSSYPVDLIGYAIGVLSVVVSITLHLHSQKKHREQLARLLDPHVIHQDLVRCRKRILRKKVPLYLRISRPAMNGLYGLHDLRILQHTIKNVQKYVLVVRSENYNEYERLLAEAVVFLRDGHPDKGLEVLDEAIALLAAEAKVLSD